MIVLITTFCALEAGDIFWNVRIFGRIEKPDRFYVQILREWRSMTIIFVCNLLFWTFFLILSLKCPKFQHILDIENDSSLYMSKTLWKRFYIHILCLLMRWFWTFWKTFSCICPNITESELTVTGVGVKSNFINCYC